MRQYLKSATRSSKWNRRSAALVILLLLQFTCTTWADVDPANAARFKVKYRSIDRVYLEGGKNQGLYEGTILTLEGADLDSVRLIVVYASDNSASCEFLAGGNAINRDVWLTVLQWGTPPETVAADKQSSDSLSQSLNVSETKKPKENSRRFGNRTSGSLSLQWYSWQDNTAANLDFGQTTARFNLHAQELWGRPLALRVRSRGQYDQRNRNYSTGAPDNEFVNRLYELSLRYGSEESSLETQLGRLLPRKLSRVGYIDGISFDLRPSEGWHAGVLGGMKPRWQFREEEVSIQKYGAYTGYELGSFRETYFEEYLAFVGEYHGSNISREFFHMRGRLQNGAGWSFSHQLDFELNRRWRFDRTDSRLSLSNVYVNARYRLSKMASVGATYDSRQNYWTIEQQTTADSLFDDELRKGVRGNLNLRFPYQFNLNTQVGYRDNAGDVNGTVSYSAYLSKSRIITSRSRLSVRYSGFDGPINDGYSYSFRADQNLSQSISLGGGYGAYSYTTQSTGLERISRWWEGELRVDLPYSLFTHGRYQHSYGDDIEGNTLQLELGKRF